MGPHWRHNYDRSLTFVEAPPAETPNEQTPDESPKPYIRISANRSNGTRHHFGGSTAVGRIFGSTAFNPCAIHIRGTSKSSGSRGISTVHLGDPDVKHQICEDIDEDS